MCQKSRSILSRRARQPAPGGSTPSAAFLRAHWAGLSVTCLRSPPLSPPSMVITVFLGLLKPREMASITQAVDTLRTSSLFHVYPRAKHSPGFAFTVNRVACSRSCGFFTANADHVLPMCQAPLQPDVHGEKTWACGVNMPRITAMYHMASTLTSHLVTMRIQKKKPEAIQLKVKLESLRAF